MTPPAPTTHDGAPVVRRQLVLFIAGAVVGALVTLALMAKAAHAQTTLVDPGAGAAAVASAGTNSNPILIALSYIPQPYAGYAMSAFSILTTVITIAAFVVAKVPPPTTTSGAWYKIYAVVNWLAQNWGHAQSLSAPASKGIVGGPGATTAPLVATAVVPLVTATEAQKAVTVMPAGVGAAPLPPAPPAADIAAGHQAAAAFEAQKQAALQPPAPVNNPGTP